MIGTVASVSNQFDATVKLNSVYYYRGCVGGSSISVSNFV